MEQAGARSPLRSPRPARTTPACGGSRIHSSRTETVVGGKENWSGKGAAGEDENAGKNFKWPRWRKPTTEVPRTTTATLGGHTGGRRAATHCPGSESSETPAPPTSERGAGQLFGQASSMSARAPACAHSLVSEVVFSHKTHRIAITASFARPGRSGDVGAVPTLLPHQRHQRRQHARGRSLLGQRTAQQQLPEQPSRRRSSGISAKASNEPASGNAVPPLPPPGVTCVQAGLDSVECFIAPVQDSVGAKGGEGTVKKREKLDSRGTNTGAPT